MFWNISNRRSLIPAISMTIFLAAIVVTDNACGQEERKQTDSKEDVWKQNKGLGAASSRSSKVVFPQLPNGELTSLPARNASWYLGKNLGLVMTLKIRGAKPEMYKDLMEKSTALATALGLDLSVMPEVAEVADFWVAHDFLLSGSDEGSLMNRLAAAQSKDCAALFALSSEMMMAAVLYTPDVDDTEMGKKLKHLNNDIVFRVKIATVSAKFETTKDGVRATGGFVSWIEDQKPAGNELVAVTRDSFAKVESILMAEASDKDVPVDAQTDSAKMPKPETVAKTAEDVEAETFLKQFLAAGADLRKLNGMVKPTESACAKLLDAELAPRAAKVYQKLYGDGAVGIEPLGDQTELVLRRISTDELKTGRGRARDFPGGYQKVAKHLQAGFNLYEFSFVAPGETSGHRFDGLVKIDGKWFVFAKVWRVLDEKPFGLTIE